MSRKKKKTSKKEIAIRTITIIFIIIVLLIVYNFINSMQTIKLSSSEQEFFQYMIGQKVEYTGVLKMTKKDGITELQTNEGMLYLDSTPVYYKNEFDKVILPNDMAIAFPMQKGKLNKINSLSTVYAKYGKIYIEKGSLEKEVSDAFLYNGSDLYFFLEKMTLKVNGEEYKLSPLSYVNATYKGFVEIYDYDSDTYTYIEEVKGEVIATARTNKYKINLTIDTLQYESTEQLLLKTIKNLPNLQ